MKTLMQICLASCIGALIVWFMLAFDMVPIPPAWPAERYTPSRDSYRCYVHLATYPDHPCNTREI